MSLLKRTIIKLNFVTASFLSKSFASKVKKFNPRLENNYPKDEKIDFHFKNIHCNNISPYWLQFQPFHFFSSFTMVETNCDLIGMGLLVDKKGVINMETCLFQDEYLNKMNVNHLVVFRKFLPAKKLDKVICLSNYLERGYYHWVLECLGKLTLIPKEDLVNYQFLIGRNPSKFMLDSLELLFDIKPEQVVTRDRIRYKINECLIISNAFHRNAQTEWTNIHKPTIMHHINSIARKKASFGGKNNIIISRSAAGQRRMYGEEKIVEAFPEYDFKLIKLEECSFEKQIELFSNASIVIGTHGAGFTNIIFSKDVKVIELFPKSRAINSSFCFTEISSALDFEHHLIGYDANNSKSQDLKLNESHIELIRGIIQN